MYTDFKSEHVSVILPKGYFSNWLLGEMMAEFLGRLEAKFIDELFATTPYIKQARENDIKNPTSY